jgi:hemerythrin-like domain-containing protein
MTQSPKHALAELIRQHDEIRDLIYHCEAMADDLDAGKLEPATLLAEVARLRVVFDVHNKYEETLLRPILRESDSFGEVRVERMVADHIDEHRSMRENLGSPLTAELRATLEQLKWHLSTEERYFLTSRVLRDDVVVLESGG